MRTKRFTEDEFVGHLRRAGVLAVIKFWTSVSPVSDAVLRSKAKALVQSLINLEGREQVLQMVREADAASGTKTDLSSIL